MRLENINPKICISMIKIAGNANVAKKAVAAAMRNGVLRFRFVNASFNSINTIHENRTQTPVSLSY